MHMMSKKNKLRSTGYFEKVQNPYSSGDCKRRSANPRGFVHDLDLFVTVQLLDENACAVPSLGKLCEDHGYSYEWVSGQKPRLTRQEKSIISVRRSTSYLLTFQFYPPILKAVRSSLRREAGQASREVVRPRFQKN